MRGAGGDAHRARVADGDGGVGMQRHDGGRQPDDVRPPEDDDVLACRAYHVNPR